MYRIKDLPEWKRKEYARRTASVRARLHPRLEANPVKANVEPNDDGKTAIIVFSVLIGIFLLYMLIKSVIGIIWLIFALILLGSILGALAGIAGGIASIGSGISSKGKSKGRNKGDSFSETAFWVNVFDDSELS